MFVSLMRDEELYIYPVVASIEFFDRFSVVAWSRMKQRRFNASISSRPPR